MEKYTEQQIEQLAPDNNLKNAKGLVKASKWPSLGVSERALWGECQGSGKNPYRVAIDGQNLAFKCSCPSRKFPCKHALGLMLMYSAFESSFKSVEVGQEADFVKEWLDKRTERAQKKEEKAAEAAKKPVNVKAQAKRQAERNAKIMDGLDLLEQWLMDVCRTGLSQGLGGANDIYKGACDLERRMVDAQAPALGKRLNKIAELSLNDHSDMERNYLLLRELSLLYLISQSFRRYDSLSADWQGEMRRLIGINESKDEVLASPGIADEWLILDKLVETDGKITTNTYIAYGLHSQRFAFFLVFVPKNVMASEVYMPGQVYTGTVHYYPGVGQIRRAAFVAGAAKSLSAAVDKGTVVDKSAVVEGGEVVQESSAKASADIDSAVAQTNAANVATTAAQTYVTSAASQSALAPCCYASFKEMLEAKVQHFAQNPFAFSFPAFVSNVRFATTGSTGNEQWYVVDAQGHAFPLKSFNTLSDCQQNFLAITLGRPFTAFLLLGIDNLDLRGILFEGHYYA